MPRTVWRGIYAAFTVRWTARVLLTCRRVTAPRRIVPGTCYLVSRRCSQRQFLLRPSAVTNEVFGYCLAFAAMNSGVLVHAFCVMSNHWHAVVTDTDGRLPEFQQRLNSLVARAMNAWLGRWESFWAPPSYSAVTLVEPADIVAKAAYALANPVTAGLVRSAKDWPGLWSAPDFIGGPPLRFARPKHFFRENGPMPPYAELQLVPPLEFSATEFRTEVEECVRMLERNAVAAADAEKRSFLGTKGVLLQAPTSRPTVEEPRRVLNPRIACRDRWKRAEALCRHKAFLADYRRALLARREGQQNVVFPRGTYLLRIAHGVTCEAFG